MKNVMKMMLALSMVAVTVNAHVAPETTDKSAVETPAAPAKKAQSKFLATAAGKATAAVATAGALALGVVGVKNDVHGKSWKAIRNAFDAGVAKRPTKADRVAAQVAANAANPSGRVTRSQTKAVANTATPVTAPAAPVVVNS